MDHIYLVRLGETYLKGKNKPNFENKIINDIKDKTNNKATIKKSSGLFIVYSKNEIIDELKKVFGIASISKAVNYLIKNVDIDSLIKEISDNVNKYILKLNVEQKSSFKIIVKRRNKSLELNSTNIGALIGENILKKNPSLRVDINNPKLKIYVDLRKEEYFIYDSIIKGSLGLSKNSNGKAVSMLSGGIDSPVSSYLMMRRGMKIYPIHFFSYPYTSLDSKEKIKLLAEKLLDYTNEIELTYVNIKTILETITKKAPNEMITLLTRRVMLILSCMLLREKKLDAVITGDSLGQVASQTIESINAVSKDIKETIFRPLIGLEKTEIMEIAREIGTYEISIMPYDDCCSVFLPKKPLLHPKSEIVKDIYKKIDIDSFLEEAFLSKEIVFLTK